jgi:hypothetical protein
MPFPSPDITPPVTKMYFGTLSATTKMYIDFFVTKRFFRRVAGIDMACR